MVGRILVTASIVLLGLICAACSYSVDFVVVNESNEQIEVDYILSLSDYSSSSGQITSPPENLAPHKTTVTRWERGVDNNDWRPSFGGEFYFDSKTGQIKIKVAPREVLRLIQINDGVYFADGYKRFPVTRLEVRGPSGRMLFEGPQLFAQFSRHASSDRFIKYGSLPLEK